MARRTFKTGLWDSFKSGRDMLEEERQYAASRLQDRTRNELVTEKYQYGALKDSALSIRLLKLLPGTRQEDIALQLRETHLDECAGTYEALSYVWGDTSEKTPILIDGQTLEIGTNLRCALFNLRLLDEPRVLWIDAICIDQTSIKERNQQVAAMGEIYRRASKTLVWLGDEVKETATAFSMLVDLAEEALLLAQVERSSTTGSEHLDVAHLDNLPTSLIERDGVSTPMFDRYKNDYSILHIAGCSWWYRAWTIQEILLASRATVVAGRYAIDWDRFCVAANHGLKLGLWMPLTMGIVLDPIVMPYISVQLLRRKRQLQGPKTASARDLLDLLVRCRFREATDPRDKIYALLGLLASSSLPGNDPSSSPPLGIRPDYASPTGAVYAHAARQILLKSGTLDLLGAGPLPASESLLPSWVPDWSVTDLVATQLTNDALGQPRDAHATRRSVALPRFLDAGATLILEAHEVTTLIALAPPLARIQFRSKDEIDRQMGRAKFDGSLASRLALLSAAWKLLAAAYEMLMSVVPHLGTYADWEAFAREVPPTNLMHIPRRAKSWPRPPERGGAASGSGTIGSLIRMTSDITIATGSLADSGEEEEPDDLLAVYWQTLCTGTYTTDADAVSLSRGRKIATQQLFYSWRASLKPIRDLHQWQADRMLRPLGFVGYVMKTWRGYSEFVRFVEGAYERRLGRGANGYLCLVPAMAEIGDKIVLAKGGQVPLVVRQDNKSECWRFVGEAYVHGIMDGQVWDETKCVEIKMR